MPHDFIISFFFFPVGNYFLNSDVSVLLKLLRLMCNLKWKLHVRSTQLNIPINTVCDMAVNDLDFLDLSTSHLLTCFCGNNQRISNVSAVWNKFHLNN